MRISWLVWLGVIAFSGFAEAYKRNSLYGTSWVFVTATNRQTGKSVKVCGNYLQYQTRLLPTKAEDAPSYKLQWWDGQERNLAVCNVSQTPAVNDTTRYKGSIVPLSYRIHSHDGRTSCTRHFTSNSTDFKGAPQYEVDQLKAFGAEAGLLLLERGEKYLTTWRDYLFSDFTDPFINATAAIPTFFAYKEDLIKRILALDEQGGGLNLDLRMHRPGPTEWDLSLLLIWVLAVGAVVSGGFWAFHRHNVDLFEWRRKLDVDEQEGWAPSSAQSSDSRSSIVFMEMKMTPDVNNNGKDEHRKVNSSDRDDEKGGCCTRHANVVAIAILMVVLVSILMLGYLFRPVLIVIFNLFLVVLGSFSVYGCANALLSNFKCSPPQCCVTPICSRFPEMGCISHAPSWGALSLYLCSLGVCVTWFVLRSAPYAWIALDFINFTMCLHILKSLRLPSLKWITGLMVCMFIYDLFMVFITPLITPDGCSVMLQVATGIPCDTSKEKGYPTPPIDAQIPEKFPMLMQVMHFDPMLECVDIDVERGYQMTILGLGDIIIPGYLISHCFTMGGFERRTRLIYGIISSIGYGIGLVVTFGALTIMGIAQPALIYLVPCTLAAVLGTALLRHELPKMWHGSNDGPEDAQALRQVAEPTSTTTRSSSLTSDGDATADHLRFEEVPEAPPPAVHHPAPTRDTPADPKP